MSNSHGLLVGSITYAFTSSGSFLFLGYILLAIAFVKFFHFWASRFNIHVVIQKKLSRRVFLRIIWSIYYIYFQFCQKVKGSFLRMRILSSVLVLDQRILLYLIWYLSAVLYSFRFSTILKWRSRLFSPFFHVLSSPSLSSMLFLTANFICSVLQHRCFFLNL